MKVACVIHRYGDDIAGGSEAHCRAVAGRLAAAHDVTVLTTCARDHITWTNVYPEGETVEGGVRVHRFPVARERSMPRFNDVGELVLGGGASPGDEEAWFRENGPDSPALLHFLSRHGAAFDRVLFWAFRYACTFFGLPLVADRAVLVPTAEADPVMRLDVLERFFALPAAFVFLTPEEQALVARRAARPLAPAVVIGCGIDPPPPPAPVDLGGLGIPGPFALYLGRVDPNKGCDALFTYFLEARSRGAVRVPLVLAGPSIMPVPADAVDSCARLRGRAGAGRAAAGGVPAHRAVALREPQHGAARGLEPWSAGAGQRPLRRAAGTGAALRRRPLLPEPRRVRARAPVLLDHPGQARRLGGQGRDYVEREYRWPAVMQKLNTVLES